jgi:ribonuclease-3
MSKGGEAATVALERRIGYEFRDRDLLLTALTHPSAVVSRRDNYERLEFLGDRVLGLVISEMLIAAFPDAREGELGRRLSDLVRAETCAVVATEIDLASALRVGGIKSETLRRTVNILGDACEALLAAIYLDGGLEPARRFIVEHWQRRMIEWKGIRKDPKSALQEWAMSKGWAIPAYAIVGRSGPDHAPRFEVEVNVETLAPCRGEGRTRQEAEQDAAAAVLVRQGVWKNEVDEARV